MVEFIIIGGIVLIVGGFGSLFYIEYKKESDKRKKEKLEKQKEIAEIKRKQLEEQTKKMQETLRVNLAKAEEEQKQRYKEAVKRAKEALKNVDASVERAECVVGSEIVYATGGHGNGKMVGWEVRRNISFERTNSEPFTRIKDSKVIHKREVYQDDLDYLEVDIDDKDNQGRFTDSNTWSDSSSSELSGSYE